MSFWKMIFGLGALLLIATPKSYGWDKPQGKSIVALGTDGSASMTPATLAKQASLLDSVASRVTGDNLFSLYTMGSKVYRHNTGASEAGRVAVLKNWKEFKPYRQDSLFTNCTAAVESMINDVIPLIQQGYIAEVILITDGKHEPPPDQNDEDVQWNIESALTGIPIEHRNRLRIDIVEVGALLEYSGQVAGLLPSGFTTTRRADDWDDVAPIVMDLQRRIEGRYGWVNAPVNVYRIGAPQADDPMVLGPFTFALAGPEQVDVQIDLATNDLVDSSEQLVLEASVDNGDWIRLSGELLTLQDNSAVRFRFHENSRHQLPFNWFEPWQRKYALKVQPVDNLIPLVREGEEIKVQPEKPAFVWEFGAWLTFGVLAVLGLFVFLMLRLLRSVRRRYEAGRRGRAARVRPVLTIQFNGDVYALATGQSLAVGPVVFTASPDGLAVMAVPEVPVRLEYLDSVQMRKVRQSLVPSERADLNPQCEARLINLTDGQEHLITPPYSFEEVEA